MVDKDRMFRITDAVDPFAEKTPDDRHRDKRGIFASSGSQKVNTETTQSEK